MHFNMFVMGKRLNIIQFISSAVTQEKGSGL